jgi:hypothetical protein
MLKFRMEPTCRGNEWINTNKYMMLKFRMEPTCRGNEAADTQRVRC